MLSLWWEEKLPVKLAEAVGAFFVFVGNQKMVRRNALLFQFEQAVCDTVINDTVNLEVTRKTRHFYGFGGWKTSDSWCDCLKWR